nr:MAG TPA: hypothetical protein [Caudoviricetes sp.]
MGAERWPTLIYHFEYLHRRHPRRSGRAGTPALLASRGIRQGV